MHVDNRESKISMIINLQRNFPGIKLLGYRTLHPLEDCECHTIDPLSLFLLDTTFKKVRGCIHKYYGTDRIINSDKTVYFTSRLSNLISSIEPISQKLPRYKDPFDEDDSIDQ